MVMRKFKKKFGDRNKSDEEFIDEDFFAQLPTEIIHYILSFLITPLITPKGRFIDCYRGIFLDIKEAARTMILSKIFLKAWSTFPDLYFSDKSFSKSLQHLPENPNQVQEASMARERFANYVLHTLMTYQRHNIPIRRLSLNACVQEVDKVLVKEYHHLSLEEPPSEGDDKIANILDQAIRKANENGVKEICLLMARIPPSNLLQTIFALKNLVSLILFSCDLVKKDIFTNCSFLKMLKLEHVRINEEFLLKLFQSCQLIEQMQIYYCQGIETIRMANLPKLKRLEFFFDNKQIVDVKVASLEKMLYGQLGSCPFVFKIDSTKNLKILKLQWTNTTDAQFHSLIAKCHVLEKLILQGCEKLQKINVSSHSLCSLSIILCMELTEVKINAPNLNLFEFIGEIIPSPLSFASEDYGKRSSSVTLILNDDKLEALSFLKLREFLMTFKPSDDISLDIRSSEISFDRNIVDNLRDENNIPGFEEVLIAVSSPSSMYSTLMEGLSCSFSSQIINVERDLTLI